MLLTTQPPESPAGPSPAPSVAPAAAWTSITWAAADPAPFSGPGNQYVFGGVAWPGGIVLVGEEAPLPNGNVDGVVWSSVEARHWQRVPNQDGTFSGAEIEAVSASSSTLVAVGDSRLEDNATTMAPPIGIAWVSSDGAHWQRVPDVDGILGNIVLHGIAVGPPGFVAYGIRLDGTAGLAFSTDGLHWQREDTPTFAASDVAGIAWTGHGFAAVGSRNDAQPSGVVGQSPGHAAAWWSTDGQNWHESDVGSTGYALQSVEPWVDSLRAIGIPPCFGCLSGPAEWRSSDDGRTWRMLPMPSTPPTQSTPTELLVGQRAFRLQGQAPQDSWSADDETWTTLRVSGIAVPSDAQLAVAGDQIVIALGSVTVGTVNDQEDMRVYTGQLR